MILLRSVAGLMAVGALLAACSAQEPNCSCGLAPRGCVYTGRADCPCAAMVCSDIGPAVDLGAADVGFEAGIDAGADAGTTDAGADAGADASTTDTGIDAGIDAGTTDTGIDAGIDAGVDRPAVAEDEGVELRDRPVADVGGEAEVFDGAVRVDAAGRDVVAVDATRDDAGLLMCAAAPSDRACATDGQCVLGTYQLNCVGEQRVIAFSPRAAAEFALIRACWALAAAEVVRCSDRPSRGTEVEQTGTFVSDPSTLVASCRAGQCVARQR